MTKTFTRLNQSGQLTHKGELIKIIKFQKDGTKRTFFKAEINGVLIGKTLFARMYDAENYGMKYIDWKQSQ